MPSRAITVSLNYDQSKKFVFLPPGQGLQPPKEAILREARNKFRIKALSTVYIRGGTILCDDDTLPELSGQIWVGKGEPYAGPPLDSTRADTPGEVRIIRYESEQ